MRAAFLCIAGVVAFVLAVPTALAQTTRPVEINRDAREVRVACRFLEIIDPLEFICVGRNGPDHESLLITDVPASTVHTALIGIGLTPGRPLRYSEAADRWIPPSGPPLRIEVEWTDDDGTLRREPINALVRDLRTGASMPQRPFVFVGSQFYTGGDGVERYAADGTGQVVSLVNFEFPTIDVGELKSNANETLEWEINRDLAPGMNTPAVMILSPIGGEEAPATQPAPDSNAELVIVVKVSRTGDIWVGGEPVSLDALADEVRRAADTKRAIAPDSERAVPVRVAAEAETPFELIRPVMSALLEASVGPIVLATPQPAAGAAPDRLAELRAEWERRVLPQSDALRTAAQTHYEVMEAYQTEINRLLDEADQLRREMDELQAKFNDLTTPQPGGATSKE